jgi:hypothetical protein
MTAKTDTPKAAMPMIGDAGREAIGEVPDA